MPVRIQRRRTKGWRLPEGAVCVSRPGPWGNPFPVIKGVSTSMGVAKVIWAVGTWESPAMWFRDTKAEAGALSIAAHRSWLGQPAQSALVDRARIILRGCDIACWCGLTDPCHGDTWLEIANAPLTCEPADAP